MTFLTRQVPLLLAFAAAMIPLTGLAESGVSPPTVDVTPPKSAGKPKGAAAQSACNAHGRGSEAVLALVKKLIAAKKLTAAELCLKTARLDEPEDRDLVFQLARVVAWQGRVDEAKTVAEPMYNGDEESRELAATLDRYEQGRAAPVRLPNAMLGSLGTPSAAERSLVGGDLSYYTQSQGQSMHEQHVYGLWAQRSWLFGIDLLDSQRYFPKVELEDQTIELSAAYLWAGGAETELIIGDTPGSHFSFERMVQLRHELPISKTTYVGGELRAAKYPNSALVLAALYGGFYADRWHGVLTLYKGFDAHADRSALIEGDSTFGNWTPAVFVGFGHGDASRPYLVKSSGANFRLLGLKVSSLWASHLQPYAVISWRTESNFYERMVQIGITWFF